LIPKLAVACLGNPILGDDAFGLLVARELEGVAGADVLSLEGGGLDVALKLIPYSQVLIIDAIETADGKVGELVELAVEELASMKGLEGHALSLSQALEALKPLAGEGPRTVQILACRISPVEEYGEAISPPVRSAVPRCARMAKKWVLDRAPPRNL
jgi:hydrogenase maturation protease